MEEFENESGLEAGTSSGADLDNAPEEIDGADEVFGAGPGTKDEDVFAPQLRNLIVLLLRNGSISNAENSEAYTLYQRCRLQVRQYLRNINLHVKEDQQFGIAYIENLNRDEENNMEDFSDDADQKESADRDMYLIIPRKISAYDSIVLLLLRKFYHIRANEGETTVVLDVERLEAMMTPYMNELTVSSIRDRRKINGTLARFREKHLIRIINSSEGDRIVISPMIRSIIGLKEMERLLEAYSRYASEHGVALAADGESADA